METDKLREEIEKILFDTDYLESIGWDQDKQVDQILKLIEKEKSLTKETKDG